MKKGVALIAVFTIGVFGAVVFLLVMISAQDKITRDTNACADGTTDAVPATSYAGDLGAIRPPWVGAATYTSKFGMRVNPGNLWKGQVRMHEGIDIAETPAPTLVVSATKGTFKRNWTSAEGANVAEVDVGGGTVVQYVHLASFAPDLRPGDPIWPGRPLGVEGSTGNSSGPHLHFGVTINGTPTEPWTWLKQHGMKGTPDPRAEGTVLPVGPPPVTNKPKDASTRPATDSSSAASNGDGSSAEGNVVASEVELPATTSPGQEFSTNPPAPIPSNYLALYQSAGRKYGVPWQLVAAIGMAETGHGRLNKPSSAGALGPMQFMPATWASEGIDGNKDGTKDILNPEDEIPATAKKLATDGATRGPDGVRRAILAYNHSQEYVNSVVSYAKFYAGGKTTISAASGGDTSAATRCDVAQNTSDTSGGAKPSGAYETAAVEAAKSQMGAPYVWGGGTTTGPSNGGFDCSGFAMFVVAQATKKAGTELDLTHSSDQQHTDPRLATVATYSGSGNPDYSTMRPGDLIVFNLVDGQARHPWNHVGIYLGDGQMIHAPHLGERVTVEKVSAAGKGGWAARRPKMTYTGSPSSSVASTSSPNASSSLR